jgi:hypothetical protein
MLALVVVLVALSGAALGGGASAASAAGQYRFDGAPWPRGVVHYYNAAPSQAWALRQAVAAWNGSGAHVRFVPSSRSRAKLIVRHDRAVASCNRAEATVGRTRQPTVLIFPLNDASRSCSRWAAARALAHELGHVLGLKHEDGGCAAMNSSGSYQGGASCEPAYPSEWRCRLLEADDVRGIVKIYGGKVKPVRTPPTCPLTAGIRPPTGLVASYDASHRAVKLKFRRAPDPPLPQFLAGVEPKAPRGYGFLRGRDACPTHAMLDAAPRYAWPHGKDSFERFVDQPPPGRYCYAVWSFDRFGRPSSGRNNAWVVVP